jgi:nucleoside-diphosphate-sugar epimerase
MNILVTGGGGYIGTVLCKQLIDRGHNVRCVDNFHKGQCDSLIHLIPSSNFEFMYGDVTIPASCKRMVQNVDGIIHLAGLVGFPACKRNPLLAHAVNVIGTENILCAWRKYAPKARFVNSSTGSVYGKVDGVCTEESPLNAQSLYGAHKKEAEDMVSDYDNTVSFRFATGFGVSPNMRVNLLVNDFVHQAINQKSLVIFQADFRRTFVHVRDMARALIFGLFKTQLKHKVYNCGANSLNWTKRELAEYIKDRTGCSIFYGEIGQDEDQRDYEVSYNRLNVEGWNHSISIEQGIEELIKVTPLLQIKHQYA